LKKRTSINSIPKIHKEKEMADFRRWLYALALVALITGLTVPASAQSGAFACNVAGAPANVRAEGYTELVGDVLITCTGGKPTAAGQFVPQATITASLNTNITSKLTTSSGWSEALLIIDEPNSPGNPGVPILNCGNGGNDTGPSGSGVCAIISDGNPADTYKGLPGYAGATAGIANPYNPTGAPSLVPGLVATCGATTYGCGFPNVFQAHTGTAQNTGQANSVVWSNVPIDPPGTGTVTRFLRITNVRSDAESLGVSTTLTLASVTMSLNVQPGTALPLNAPSVLVASVFKGLFVSAARARLDFTQCISENGKLFAGTLTGGTPYFGQGCTTSSSSGCSAGGPNGGSANTIRTQDNGDYVNSTPTIRFAEGFNTAFKAKNVSDLTSMGTANTSGWVFNAAGTIVLPAGDQNQNVPGAVYSTESGFEFPPTQANPNPNPPTGIGSTPVGATDSAGGSTLAFSDTATGINLAGSVTQGTRLIATFSSVANGSQLYVPAVTYLYRQNDTTYSGSTPADPTKFLAGHSTGVAVLVTTDSAGASTIFSGVGGSTVPNSTTPLVQVPITAGSGFVTYEVLFDDPGSLENVDIPVVVAYAAALTSNPPIGLPVPGIPATFVGGFAPFYTSVDGTSANARLPQLSYPVPRFIPGYGPYSLFEVQKCACNLLFPYVTNQGGYDTGIAIANTSMDPGGGVANTNDFGAAQPQTGSVTLWYYGQGANNTAAPASQTSSPIAPGQLMLYALSSGNPAQNLTNSAAGFEGYIIAQAGFQYCHGLAFIEALGGGPSNPAAAYLGIILDAGGLPRTNSIGENDAH
jgi:hypothetical protein